MITNTMVTIPKIIAVLDASNMPQTHIDSCLGLYIHVPRRLASVYSIAASSSNSRCPSGTFTNFRRLGRRLQSHNPTKAGDV